MVLKLHGPWKTQRAVCRSYVAKTTEQLEHALAATQAAGVELRAVEVVGEGSEGSAASQREVERVRSEVREDENNQVAEPFWYFDVSPSVNS